MTQLTLKEALKLNGISDWTLTPPRQIPVNDTLEVLFKSIRKEHGFKSKYVFFYDGQIIETKSCKVRKPKKISMPSL